MTFNRLRSLYFLQTTLRIAVLMILTVISLAAHAKSYRAKPLEFMIKPRVCVIEEKQASCRDKVKISWATGETLSICLFIKEVELPLQCWIQQEKGKYFYQADTADYITFQLREKFGNELLASKIFEVIREQKEYRRRRRNPWSFF